MITAICHQPACRRHWVVTALSDADTHEEAQSCLAQEQCPSCQQPLTPHQRQAFLQCFDEVLEMERSADVEYWWGMMFGGGPSGLH